MFPRRFERVVTIKINVKKMKTFFKKWLEFESSLVAQAEENGDGVAEKTAIERVEHVKSSARAFVERVSA